MENRLKERLTGAAILVALIVLLVPEMFHGQRSEVPASAGSSGEGPPLRSYTIDLSNGAARTAPLQSTAVAVASGADEHSPEPAPAPPPSSSMGTAAVAVVKSDTSSAQVAPAASAGAASSGAVSAARPKALEHVAA